MSQRRAGQALGLIVLASIGLWPKAALAQTSRVSISGNKLVNEQGQEMIFRGVNALDPLAMNRYMGHFDDSYFTEMQLWNATVVRLPVHPSEWHNTYYRDPNKPGRNKYQVIENAITMAASHGMYSIIDWHVIGYPPTKYWASSSYRTDQAEMEGFWRDMATRYRNDPRVVAYELFNEPVKCRSCWQVTDADWIPMRDWYERMIDVVRAIDPDKPIIATGLDWGYQLWPMNDNPIRRTGLVYSAHPYPSKSLPWETYFGFKKATDPVIVTEVAFENEADGGTFPEGQYNDNGGTGIYRWELFDYLESKGIGWIAWSFGPNWSPELTYDWNYTPTEQGQFWKDRLQSFP